MMALRPVLRQRRAALCVLTYCSRGVQRRGVASVSAATVHEEADYDTRLPYEPHTIPIRPNPPSSRLEAVRNAEPFSDFLTDTFSRQHDYLRISITERCNLRCLYCMPEEGIELSPPDHLLSTKEILHIARLFVSQGVTKIRLTGGEPTVRKDIVELVTELGKLKSIGLKELAMTSNGISLARKLPKLVEGGLTGLNLSLDTLDEFKFQMMTRRNGFDKVMKTIEQALALNVTPLKINCVVMNKLNDHEIPAFVALTRDKPIEVRFIEYMPFSGNKWTEGKMISYESMLTTIRASYPTLYKIQDHKNDTSKTYHIPGHKGKIGFITSMTHNFCGTCNRLRITSDGNLKVCLFGNAEVSLRDMMRIPGGMEPAAEAELLKVIGKAVKKKEEKHAGIGDLEKMPNRPMILIGERGKSVNASFSLGTGKAPWHRIPTSILPQCTAPGYFFTQPYSTNNKPPWTLSEEFQKSFPDFELDSSKPAAASSTDQEPASVHNPTTTAPAKPSLTRRVTSHQISEDSIAREVPLTQKPFQELSQPEPEVSGQPRLTHVNAAGTARMVSIHGKEATLRKATAIGTVWFTGSVAPDLITSNSNKKGDVLSVARIAGIMATKRTAEIIPLCHPIMISHVSVDFKMSASDKGRRCVKVTAKVACSGKTGVEMEALMAVTAACLTVYDMCKAVDRGMQIQGVQVSRKSGGQSGEWHYGSPVTRTVPLRFDEINSGSSKSLASEESSEESEEDPVFAESPKED